MARLLPGPDHLADEALRSLGDMVAVTDAARARIEVIVLHRHGRECFRRFEGWRSGL
jgi:hypothetical protein